MRVGILTQFPSQSVQSGPALQSRFLYHGLRSRGHQVRFLGPDTRSIAPCEDPSARLFPAYSYPTHPNVRLSMPGSLSRAFSESPDVDVLHSQAASQIMHYGLWARDMWSIPLINTHIIHLPTHIHFLMSDKLWATPMVKRFWQNQAHQGEVRYAALYNRGDCLVVQSRHFVKYWRERGVTVPIEVVGRPLNPEVFSRQPTCDPYPERFEHGKRLVVACRHDREKNLERLVNIFSHHIAPSDPRVTLTLVGDGHDHKNLYEYVRRQACADRIYLPGEASHQDLVNWYAHADLFVYTSVSETFGNVVNEALWSGLPVVALDDQMGVAGQVVDDVNGHLIDPDRPDGNAAFAATCVNLLRDRSRRRAMGEQAANLSRLNSHPDVVLKRFEQIYADAQDHCRRTLPVPLVHQGFGSQIRAFSREMSLWVGGHALVLGIAHAATRLGAARTGGAIQHTADMHSAQRPDRQAPEVENQSDPIEATGR